MNVTLRLEEQMFEVVPLFVIIARVNLIFGGSLARVC